MKRRDFLKNSASAMAALVVLPLPVFIPPRDPFISYQKSLMNLYSHLGVLPSSKELGICEGELLEIGSWDGIGYPCLIENVCCYGNPRPRVWIYDFDLWNFRHDDHKRCEWFKVKDFYPNSHLWHAHRRFGEQLEKIVDTGGGFLKKYLPDIRQLQGVF